MKVFSFKQYMMCCFPTVVRGAERHFTRGWEGAEAWQRLSVVLLPDRRKYFVAAGGSRAGVECDGAE